LTDRFSAYAKDPLPHHVTTERSSRSSALRRAIADKRHAPAIEAQTMLKSLSEEDRVAFWGWWKGGGPSARERNTHLRLAYGATPTNLNLYRAKRFESPLCTDCTLNLVDSISHYWFDCPSARSFWSGISPLLSSLISRNLSPPLHQYEDLQIFLGLPHLCKTLKPPQRRALRTFFTIAFQVSRAALSRAERLGPQRTLSYY